MGTFVTVLLSIVAVILLVILFFLFSPLWIHLVYDQKLTVVAGVSFIGIKIIPGKKKNKKTLQNKQSIAENPKQTVSSADRAQKTSSASQDKTRENDKKDSSNSVFDTITTVSDIVKSFLDMMGKKAKVDIKALTVTVAGKDAASTAVYFGLCSGAVSTVLALASNAKKCKVNHKNVGAIPDFLGNKSSISADIKMSAPTISVIICLLKGYFKNN